MIALSIGPDTLSQHLLNRIAELNEQVNHRPINAQEYRAAQSARDELIDIAVKYFHAKYDDLMKLKKIYANNKITS